MPHLSPMSWILTPLTFIFLFILFITSIWWHQTPNFPHLPIPSNISNSPWNWT